MGNVRKLVATSRAGRRRLKGAIEEWQRHEMQYEGSVPSNQSLDIATYALVTLAHVNSTTQQRFLEAMNSTGSNAMQVGSLEHVVAPRSVPSVQFYYVNGTEAPLPGLAADPIDVDNGSQHVIVIVSVVLGSCCALVCLASVIFYVVLMERKAYA